MNEYEASIVPDQPWEENGSAEVTPLPPYPETESRKLPLENREPADMTIYRTNYPQGLVIIPTDNRPTGSTATLPLRASDGSQVVVGNSRHQDWPEGIVVVFTD